MCNILILSPGQMPVYSEFENMCWNNWHSYGLVTKVDNKLDIRRKIFPDDSLSLQDIKDLYKLLEDDLKYERILHVRHITAGSNSEDNCHPLPAYYSEKREVVFMHNGTLYDWQGKKYSTNTAGVTTSTVDYDGPSDSKNFCDKVIQPMLAASDFGSGHGDIESLYTKMIFNKLWGADNRGILISSDQPSLFLGIWGKMNAKDGSDIKSANEKYFDDVIRGPEKIRREESSKKSTSNVISITQIKDLNKLGKVDPEKYRINIRGFEDISNDWNLYDYEGLSSLGNLTNDELDILFEDHPVDAQLLFDLVSSSHQKLWEEYQALKVQVAS